jgi:hypothetical protein
MRSGMILLVLALGSTSNMCGLGRSEVARPVATQTGLKVDAITADKSVNQSSPAMIAKVDFAIQVEPILQSRCQGCHFAGGVMYQRLPFDRPETIKTLGEKLFTRLKDENDRQVIREFLSQ